MSCRSSHHFLEIPGPGGVPGERRHRRRRWIRRRWKSSVRSSSSPSATTIIATTFAADAPHGRPVYVVAFDKRSPDGTINMSRRSRTGQAFGFGFGFVEEMTFDLDRLSPSLARVVVGVAIHQDDGYKTFGDVSNTGVTWNERACR